METNNTPNNKETVILASGSPAHQLTDKERSKGGSMNSPKQILRNQQNALKICKDAGKALSLSQKIISDPSVSAQSILECIEVLESKPGIPIRERTRLVELRLRLHEASFGRFIRQVNANMDIGNIQSEMAKFYDSVPSKSTPSCPPDWNKNPQDDDIIESEAKHVSTEETSLEEPNDET